MTRGKCMACLAAALALAACGGDGDDGGAPPPVACTPAAPALPPQPVHVPPALPAGMVAVSDASPFAAGCGQDAVCGTLYTSSEVEPQVSANPLDDTNLVGVWQQDRWGNGGAQGLLAAFTKDGGATWTARQAPFSRCTGGNSVNGGNYARATDPWISFGPDGRVYWMAMTITDLPSGSEISAMRVSRSLDGGDTWSAPITLIEDTSPFFSDKNAITADPTSAAHVYAVWDRLDFNGDRGPAYFTRTTNGGNSWEAARPIYDPGQGAQTVGNQVAVLSDGTVLNLFTEIHYDSLQPDGAFVRVMRSTNRGQTWSAPVTVSALLAVGVSDPDSGIPVRSGAIIADIAVAPDDTIWVVWQDSRGDFACIPENPCYGTHDRIVIASSSDGGQTWSAPVRISGDEDVPAFTPTVHVAADGTIGVSYYDLRDDVPGDGYLLASHWLATSGDGVSWSERLVYGPFDLQVAPNAFGLFVGDYAGLTSAGGDFVPFFAWSQGVAQNRTNVYSVPMATQPVVAKAATGTGATYRAAARAPVVMTPEWALRLKQAVDANRKHFPDKPGQLPRYLR